MLRLKVSEKSNPLCDQAFLSPRSPWAVRCPSEPPRKQGDVRLKVWKLQRARVVPHAGKITSVGRTLPHSRHGATLSCKCECPSATLLLPREPLWIDALPDMALMSQRRYVFGTFRPVKTTPAPISDHKKLGLRQFSHPRVATGPLRRQRGMGLSMTGVLEVPMARDEVSPARA